MRVTACLVLAFIASSVMFGVCNATVWFEEKDPQEPQEIVLSMNHLFQNGSALPRCELFLNETQSQQVNITIIVATAAWFYQSGNFNTSIAIDSQEPEILSGVFEWKPSAMGELYNRKYNVKLSGLEDGSHSIKIQVTGDYYGPDPTGGTCLAEGNATFLVDHQTLTSPTTLSPSPTPTSLQTINTGTHMPKTEPFPTSILVFALILLAVVIASVLLIRKHQKTTKSRNLDKL